MVNLSPIDEAHRKSRARLHRAAGPILTSLLGLLLWWAPITHELVHASYDLLFPFAKSSSSPKEVVIIYQDEETFASLNQSPNQFDRSLHTDLLNFLTPLKPKVIIFDIWFADPADDGTDEEFAEAIEAAGNVVLAATRDQESLPGISVTTVHPPVATLANAAADWGIAELRTAGRQIVRQYDPGTTPTLSLPAAAARVAGTPQPHTRPEHLNNKWLRYYGPNGTFTSVSYVDARLLPKEAVQNKSVFIGLRPKTQHAFDEPEEFRTPYSIASGNLMPGVDIVATEFLNILNDEHLTRLPAALELLALLIIGVAASLTFSYLRPLKALGLGAILSATIALSAVVCFWTFDIWFAWTLPVAVQLPFGYIYSIIFHTRRLEVMVKEVTEQANESNQRAPIIPHQVLSRRIGRGSYGEVWLGSAAESFSAVKIVYRDTFDHDAPYEREYKGIKKYAPASSSHEGLVDILETGRNDKEGFFYYRMEVADDVHSGRLIEPANYQPKSLSGELDRRGALPIGECLDLMLTLTEALHHLHRHNLIHRDIKPPNIIYVNNTPKLADIGLVTEFASTAKSVTFVGTQGYIAPEGPGTPQADLYSLGKLLYVARYDADPELFPELPPGIDLSQQSELGKQLHRIIGKACQTDPALRYASAMEMHQAVLAL